MNSRAKSKYSLLVGAALACLLATTGCDTTSGGYPKPTQIITDPPGARIEINDDYIGAAPVAFTFHQSPAGYIVGNYLIRVTPTDPKLEVQTRSLEGPYVPLTGPADSVPGKLFIDLRRPPPDPDFPNF